MKDQPTRDQKHGLGFNPKNRIKNTKKAKPLEREDLAPQN